MSSYNLSDNVNDNFSFSLRGNKYVMRYPKTGELEEIQSLTARLEQVEPESEEAQEINKKLGDSIYQFISPDGHDIQIKDALKEENVKVLQNFNLMIKTEMSV